MNLAVVIVRSLSARWLGAYGNEWVATPNLDRLAAEGVVYERNIADRIDGHALSYAGPVIRFDDLVPPWSVPHDIFATYAEEYTGLEPVRQPGPIVSDDLSAWTALQCSYAAVLTRLDARIGRWIDECRRNGTAVLLTSDLGFPLGEHNVVGPTKSRPHVELVHLPLILWRPDGIGASERIGGLTQSNRVFSALAALSDDREPNLATDFSKFMDMTAMRSFVQPFAITRSTDGVPLAIRTAEWTCLFGNSNDTEDGDRDRLYLFPEDQFEVNDLAERCPERVSELSIMAERLGAQN